MKKTLLLFILVALFLLCSCDSLKIKNDNLASEISTDISSDNYVSDISNAINSTVQDKTAVIKTEKQVYATDVKIIVFEIYNYDTNESSFGVDGYRLEIKKGNDWVEVEYKKNYERNIEYLSIILPSLESWKTELNIQELYNLPLEKGIYRIGNENGIDGIDSIEFEIK